MRKRIKQLFRTARDSETWPVILLLVAVLAPAVSLLWFMNAAMRNERLASQQRITELSRGHLSLAQNRIETFLKKTGFDLDRLAHSGPAAAAFAEAARLGVTDSLVILDEHGGTLYPSSPSVFPTVSTASDRRWAQASRLEPATNSLEQAAALYHALALESTNIDLAARGFQAEARCLLRAGRADDALRLITEVLSERRFDRALDLQGRLIAANAELLALELSTHRAPEVFDTIAKRLTDRVLDYNNPMLAASQRRFLMHELRRLSPQTHLPTLAAEDLAARFGASRKALPASLPSGATGAALQPTPLPDVWQLPLPGGRGFALFHTSRLINLLTAAGNSNGFPVQAGLLVLPPTHGSEAGLVSSAAGEYLPGWRLALENGLPGSTQRPIPLYLQIGLLVLAVMGVLTVLAVRVLRRQAALARLKNDLAATVSHELKTPLSSMRVLIDTLLDSEKWDEGTAREYLQLISSENQRLSRLIQNFLTFSRMQRKKYRLQMSDVHPSAIVDAALQSTRERFAQPGCRFEVQMREELPIIRADPDALATALINLLENAWKFSAEPRHITLSVSMREDVLALSVRDNGIGLPPEEAERIFEPFYQVDQRLSRNGSGCGLGLGIVQFIVTAHGGRVTVESKPGVGSTFTIWIPVSVPARKISEEVLA